MELLVQPIGAGGNEFYGEHGHHHPESACIEAVQVFDHCFQEHRVERTLEPVHIDCSHHAKIATECEIDEEHIVCREVGKRRPMDGAPDRYLIGLAIEVPVTIRIADERSERVYKTIEKRIVFGKQVVLCIPTGARVKCVVTGNGFCFFEPLHEELTCSFDFCILVKSVADVLLRVPSLGVCRASKCQSGVECPPKTPKKYHRKHHVD